MATNIELIKVGKTKEFMGWDTPGYNAELIFKGIHVGTLIDDGRGGCAYFQGKNGVDHGEFVTILEEVWPDVTPSERFWKLEDFVIAELERREEEKHLKKVTLKKILWQYEGDDDKDWWAINRRFKVSDKANTAEEEKKILEAIMRRTKEQGRLVQKVVGFRSVSDDAVRERVNVTARIEEWVEKMGGAA